MSAQTGIIGRVQKNSLFRFFSSVRLAVPLMFVLLAASAAGTIYESRYNAELASLKVYKSQWFLGLLMLLWLNIFLATLARYPFKKHHIGFVITHIGLLTLLVGGIMTSTMGIDGQLRVVEGGSDDEVFLSQLVLRYGGGSALARSVSFPKTLRPLEGDDLGWINSKLAAPLLAEKYLPFAAVERAFVQQPGGEGVALKFGMKSQFFQVNEWLDSRQRPEMRMGPALLRLVTEKGTAPKSPAQTQARKKETGDSARKSGKLLRVKNAQSNEVVGEVSIAQLSAKPLSIGPVQIVLVKAFNRAAVATGKIAEASDGPLNPALELRVEHQGKKAREIAFAKFPTFSLNGNGTFGLKFEYLTEASGEAPEAQAESASESGAAPARNGNVIEFHVAGSDVTVELYKNGTQVMKKGIQGGETLQTPWMGMTITLDSVVRGGTETEQVKATELQQRSPLPPSAIFFRVPGGAVDDGFWLVEGSARQLPSEQGARELYFGMDSIHLPFSLKLNKFSKIDYPGTETAMSYQSEVQVNGQGEPVTIKMNEPLKRDGFTLYQSSYIVRPGEPAVSIFSVNRDPGRWVKYFGSIALCLGIIIFTFMRSNWYLRRQRA